jgi:hypothetical protein
MPRPHTARSIQYVTSVCPSTTKLAMLPTKSPSHGDCAQRDLRRLHHPHHVCVEPLPVIRVFGRECCHSDRLRIAHLAKQRVQIRLVHRP